MNASHTVLTIVAAHKRPGTCSSSLLLAMSISSLFSLSHGSTAVEWLQDFGPEPQSAADLGWYPAARAHMSTTDLGMCRCPSNPDAGQLLLSAGGMSTPGTSHGGPLLVADASGPLPTSFGDDETASRGPPSPKALSHTGSPPLHATGGSAHVNVNAAFRSHINDPPLSTGEHMLQPMQHMVPAVMPGQAAGQAGHARASPAATPLANGKSPWPEGAPQARDGAASATLASSSTPPLPRPGEWAQSSMPMPNTGYSMGMAPGQQWAVGSMPMNGQQFTMRPSVPGAPGGAVLVPASMPMGSSGMMAYPVNMGMHAGRLVQARPPARMAAGNGVYAIQAASLQGYMGMRPGVGAPQAHVATPQYYVMPYPQQQQHPRAACMPGLAPAAPLPAAPHATSAAAAPPPVSSIPHAALPAAAEQPQGTAVLGTSEAPQATANQLYAMDHNRQLMLRHQRMYSTADPAAASGSPRAKATASAQRTFVPVPAHHLQGRIYVRPPDAAGGGSGLASPAFTPEQPAAASQDGPVDVHNTSQAQPSGGGAPHTTSAAGSASISVSAAPSGSSSQTQLYAADYRQGGSGPGQLTAPQLSPGQGMAQHAQQLGGFQGPVLCMAPGQWQHGGRPLIALQPYYVQSGAYMNSAGHMYASAPMQPQMQGPRPAAGTKEGVLGGSVAMKEEPVG